MGRALRIPLIALISAAAFSGASLTATSGPLPDRCTVPKVKGKTLAAAKRAIGRAGCATGKVTRIYSKKVRKGRVVWQRPPGGATLKKGGKVSLVVSKGKRPKLPPGVYLGTHAGGGVVRLKFTPDHALLVSFTITKIEGTTCAFSEWTVRLGTHHGLEVKNGRFRFEPFSEADRGSFFKGRVSGGVAGGTLKRVFAPPGGSRCVSDLLGWTARH